MIAPLFQVRQDGKDMNRESMYIRRRSLCEAQKAGIRDHKSPPMTPPTPPTPTTRRRVARRSASNHFARLAVGTPPAERAQDYYYYY